MKKVSILTMQNIVNYGSQLQMYALYKTIEKGGYECKIINYDRGGEKSPNGLTNYISLVKDLLRKLLFNGGISDKIEKFAEFRSLMQFTSTVTSHELETGQLEIFDAYVCGSDQIWNPEFTGLDSNNYLSFAEEGARIAYAASAGTDELCAREKKIMAKLIKGIPYVSVREESICQWINDKLKHKADLVIDPTMLITASEWDSISRPINIPKTGYLVLYGLGGKVSSDLNKLAKKIADEKDLQIINILPNANSIFKKNEKCIFNMGPREFLYVIRNSSFVVTNSYHGTIFSIIYNKPFYCTMKSYGNRSISTRFKTLLELFDLEKKEVLNDNAMIWNVSNVEYDKVNKEMSNRRDKCKEWLYNSLHDVVNRRQ